MRSYTRFCKRQISEDARGISRCDVPGSSARALSDIPPHAGTTLFQYRRMAYICHPVSQYTKRTRLQPAVSTGHINSEYQTHCVSHALPRSSSDETVRRAPDTLPPNCPIRESMVFRERRYISSATKIEPFDGGLWGEGAAMAAAVKESSAGGTTRRKKYVM